MIALPATRRGWPRLAAYRAARDQRGPAAGGLPVVARLLLAKGCALSAYRLLVLAVPWLILDRTGSPARTGLVTGVQTAAYLITQTVAGPLLDRIPARRVITAGCLISVTVLLILATTTAPLVVTATAVAVLGAANGPMATAKTTLLAALHHSTGQAGNPPGRAGRIAGLAIAVERLTVTTSPILAGALLAAAGGGATLTVAAGLFGAAALASTLLPDLATPHPRSAAAAGGYLAELAAGARHIAADRLLRSLTLMLAVTNTADEALLVVLLPSWSRQHGHSLAAAGACLACSAPPPPPPRCCPL